MREGISALILGQLWRSERSVRQKRERPVGGPAAQAWELRVYGLKSVRVIIASRWA
jgi:hypothetical protein